MRGLALVVVGVLLPIAVFGREPLDPEVIWTSPAPEHASTSRWVCSASSGDIEFRFYPSLAEQNNYAWIIRHGQTFTYARKLQQGLETYFVLYGSPHEIQIGADGVAKYFAFSGQEGERLQPSALWFGCKLSR